MASRSNSSTSTSTPAASTASTKAAAKPTTTRNTTRKANTGDAAAPKAASKATSSAKKTATTLGSGSNAVQLSPEERLRYVSEAAYFIAERRGFATGSAVEDWLQAESEIDQLLAGSTRH